MGETSMNESYVVNQLILVMDFDWTFWNELGRSTLSIFGISMSHQILMIGTTFQCHWTRMNKTPSFRIDNGC